MICCENNRASLLALNDAVPPAKYIIRHVDKEGCASEGNYDNPTRLTYIYLCYNEYMNNIHLCCIS